MIWNTKPIINATKRAYAQLLIMVLGYVKLNKRESVQHIATSVFLGVNRFAAIACLEGDIGWVPSMIRQKIRKLRFWNNYFICKNTRITKEIFFLEYDS